MDEPEILFVVPCDDIRQEGNGKLMAIGIYSDSFVPSEFPATVALSLLVWMRVPSAGQYETTLEVFVEPGAKPVAGLKFGFEAEGATARSGAPIPAIPLMLKEPGAIVVRAGKDAKEVLRLPVIPPSPSV
jgi:hypothetical protein